jgi:hypothetical protein
MVSKNKSSQDRYNQNNSSRKRYDLDSMAVQNDEYKFKKTEHIPYSLERLISGFAALVGLIGGLSLIFLGTLKSGVFMSPGSASNLNLHFGIILLIMGIVGVYFFKKKKK